jgi:raffinose/stachyose/melibiose transport system permease protein
MNQTAQRATTENHTHWQRLNKLKPLPFLLPVLIIYTIFALYPIANGLILSFYSWNGISDERTFVGLRNYVQLFTADPVFWTAFRNSLVWVILSLIVPILLGLMFALSLNQKLFARSTMRAMIYLPCIIASIAVATMWTWMYNPILGLFNSILKSLQLDFLIQNWLGDPAIALYSVFVASVWHSTGFRACPQT